MKNIISNIKKSKMIKFMIIVLSFLTLFRIFLAIKMPLYLQADAGFDDYLLIDYAKSILGGDWLGPFNSMTLAKGISFPLYIVLTYLVGIPYSLGLILLYIFGILLLIVALKKYINNKYYLSIVYIFLLYSPVMFHIENVQKVYRGGVIVSLSLIVISTMINMFNNISARRKKLFTYSLLASISLPFFYYLKEDSIWIMPFVIGAILISITKILKQPKLDKKKSRILLMIMPIISLFLSNTIYCSINYMYYGEYCITDRNGTYFKEVIADIIKIEEKNEIKDVWITKDMMYKAVGSSKTLSSIKEEIDDMYDNSWALKENGQIEGDIIFWTIKEAVQKAGIYDKGGKEVNKFYQKIDKELKQAYDTGKLKKNKDKKYLSSIATGYTIDNILEYYPKTTIDAIDMLVTYSQNETSVNPARGSMEKIIIMDHLTNSATVWPEDVSHIRGAYNIIVSISNKIVKLYQVTGYPIFILGMIGLLLLTIKVAIGMKKKMNEILDIWLILLGLFCTCIALLVGVLWFCSCFNESIMRHVYNYTCGIVPIIQILEITGIYFLLKEIISFINKINLKKEYKK